MRFRFLCNRNLARPVLKACILAACSTWATASAAVPAVLYEETSARYQLTYNWQRQPAFHADYSGPNSLAAGRDRMYTFSATAHLGFRPWQDGELYFNPEVTQGVPFTGNLVGLGGFTNGEITRAAGPAPTLYRQRLFLRQTWNRGGGAERIEPEANQLAGMADRDRIVLTAGNFSTLDVFDDNAYAKDPRTQFMNWGNWTYAAYDYAADSRGFGWGAALEWYRQDWVARIGRMSSPREPNGLPVDMALGRHYGDQAELEHAHRLGARAGKVRMLAFRNRAKLADFRDALEWLTAHPGRYADHSALIAARSTEKIKTGVGINVEQSLNDDLGVFLRAMKADGHTETHAFTEADGSLAAGALAKGDNWGHAADAAGLSVGRNSISADRRRFLEAGGTAFFIGDGALRYRPETVVESFYSFNLHRGAWLTADWQRIRNPAYNADRGPVNVYALRLHAEW